MNVKRFIFFILLLFGCNNEPARLIIFNAKVWTVDRKNPVAEAIVVQGNRIEYVGYSDSALTFKNGNSRILDAGQRLMLPGFNDAHLHFLSGGMQMMNINLISCKTLAQIQRRIAEKAAELGKNKWITGRGWDHTIFNKGIWPHRGMIDSVSSDNPVFIRRVDGHVGWANTSAIKAAGIDDKMISPEGGEILRDENGVPTGIFKESAMSLIERVIPPPDESQKLLAIRKALEHARKLGITSVQDNSGIYTIKLYNKLDEMNELTLRISEWMDFDLLQKPDSLLKTIQFYEPFCRNNILRLGLLKGFVDGTLGSRTALLFEPYSDDRFTTGLPQYSEEELTKMICRAESLKLQVGLHAIGTRACWMALNGFSLAKEQYGLRDSRHRLEHAQVLLPEDIKRIGELNVVASMQPTHCTSDLRWAYDRLGRRCEGAYAWKQILQNKGKIAFGTDWPVEPLDPMRGLYSAVTRKHIDTNLPIGGWYPDERLSIEKAIELYTLGSAFAEFQEHIKGSIEQDKLADLILLSKNILSAPQADILTTRVELTVFDGKIVYRSPFL
jgi:predicted amidohydrolase YtcJ